MPLQALQMLAFGILCRAYGDVPPAVDQYERQYIKEIDMSMVLP